MEESLAFSYRCFIPLTILHHHQRQNHSYYFCRVDFLLQSRRHCATRAATIYDRQDREKKRKNRENEGFAQPRTSMSDYASVLLQLRWIPPCLSLTAAVFNRVPRVPVSIHAYILRGPEKMTEEKRRIEQNAK